MLATTSTSFNSDYVHQTLKLETVTSPTKAMK